MRLVTILAVAGSFMLSNAAGAASLEELFQQFGLFGTWATDCDKPATPANPRVSITMPSAGLVLEDHNLGPDFAVNRYSVVSAERMSATSLSVDVIFQPGTEVEERQKLVFSVRDNTRRTIFNQTNGGAVRVKDGIALARGSKTPLLRKCEESGFSH
jgi:hypothetical protein